MKYAAIAAHVGAYTVAFMCRVFGVAPSGYYAWLQCPMSKRAQQDDALQPHVRAAFQTSSSAMAAREFTPSCERKVTAWAASGSRG